MSHENDCFDFKDSIEFGFVRTYVKGIYGLYRSDFLKSGVGSPITHCPHCGVKL